MEFLPRESNGKRKRGEGGEVEERDQQKLVDEKREFLGLGLYFAKWYFRYFASLGSGRPGRQETEEDDAIGCPVFCSIFYCILPYRAA